MSDEFGDLLRTAIDKAIAQNEILDINKVFVRRMQDSTCDSDEVKCMINEVSFTSCIHYLINQFFYGYYFFIFP